MFTRGSERGIEMFAFSELAMTPPFVFAFDAFREGNDLNWFSRDTFFLGYVLVALVVWCVLALIFWSLALARFDRLTHRAGMIRATTLPGPPTVRAVS
jgi:hypothetical protein